MINKKKYLLMPGYVRSENDNDEHYISPVQLKNLYGVELSECLIHKPTRGMSGLEHLIQLKPKYNGNYIIPKDNNE